MVSQEEVNTLIDEAGGIDLKPESIKRFVSRLPKSDDVLAAALMHSADMRNIRAFQALYFAALTGDRPIPATAMVEGAALIEDVRLLLSSILKVQGDVVAALTESVRRGRLSSERESMCLTLAWLACNERGIEAPQELILETRRKIRTAFRGRSLVALVQYETIAEFTDDPVITNLTGSIEGRSGGIKASLTKLRRQAIELPWNVAAVTDLPSQERVHSGSTLVRETPRIGRNDPCPCGSGKKHKKCCLEKSKGFDDYSTDGVKISELKIAPELGLTPSKVSQMRSYEVWNLRPDKIPDSMRIMVARRLILFGDFERARKVLEQQAPENYDIGHLESLYFDLFEGDEGDYAHLRWFTAWAAGAFETYFEADAALADRETLVSMLVFKAEEAFTATLAEDVMARVHYTSVALAAFQLSKPLGILIARGVLKDAETIHHESILDAIENARDELGLAGDDQAIRISQAIEDHEDVAFETSYKLSKEQAAAKKEVEARRQQAAKLEARILALEEDLANLDDKTTESARSKAPKVPIADPEPKPSHSHSDNEIRERLAEIKRLKTNLKAEHEQHQRIKRQLENAQEELSTAQRAERTEEVSVQEDPEMDHLEPVSERARARVCLPEFSASFSDALEKVPDSLAAQAVSMAGRLAAGDKHAWNGCRHLKQSQGLMRQRLGRSHRLFFRCHEKTIEFIDLIHRQDFETWLRKHTQA
ncbi:MAG: hypothetical protein ACI9R3_005114 [Verrucomicrobiales bacterium]|jgi:hypothetical protein